MFSQLSEFFAPLLLPLRDKSEERPSFKKRCTGKLRLPSLHVTIAIRWQQSSKSSIYQQHPKHFLHINQHISSLNTAGRVLDVGYSKLSNPGYEVSIPVKKSHTMFWMLLGPFHRLSTHLISSPKTIWQKPQQNTQYTEISTELSEMAWRCHILLFAPRFLHTKCWRNLRKITTPGTCCCNSPDDDGKNWRSWRKSSYCNSSTCITLKKPMTEDKRILRILNVVESVWGSQDPSLDSNSPR